MNNSVQAFIRQEGKFRARQGGVRISWLDNTHGIGGSWFVLGILYSSYDSDDSVLDCEGLPCG